ncbi:MAG: DALR domain-containing protein, partial [Pikeienuella sp.]
DDLNTPQAIAEMHRMAREGDAAGLAGAMALMNLNAPTYEAGAGQGALIDALLARRAEAREARDFNRADEIRKGLDEAGVIVIDRKGEASEWRLGPDFDPARLETLG